LVVYTERRELRRQLSVYLEDAARHLDHLTVISGQPGEDRRLIPRGKMRSFHIHDARRIAARGVRAPRLFERILDEESTVSGQRGSKAWTWIGTWEHLLYHDFGPILEIERMINARGSPVTVCAFKNEGFCSLPLPQLSELLSLHDSFLFPAPYPAF
jgi:hypothetical protein